MLELHAASDRAARFAIETGNMPNLFVIHALQRCEGYEPCFGRSESICPRSHCRWFSSCMSLTDFDPDARSRQLPNNLTSEPLEKSVPISVLGLPHPAYAGQPQPTIPGVTRQPTAEAGEPKRNTRRQPTTKRSRSRSGSRRSKPPVANS